MTTSPAVALRRSLSLPLLVLYGLGVTVGAGIYVLVGAAAGRAGALAPAAFVIAAIVMGLSAASFSELAARMPVSAGEAVYVKEAFGSPWLSVLTGLLVITAAVVAAATIAKGAAGYLQVFLPLPTIVLALSVIVVMGLVASRGIAEAAGVAAAMTVNELSGLLAIIAAGLFLKPSLIGGLSEAAHIPTDAAVWRGMLSAAMLAFFAFIGFESIVNLAEEAHAPARQLPRAIFLTLAVSTLLYILVVLVALAFATPEELGAAPAPLSLVFQRTTGASPMVLAAIAVCATVNGIIAQFVLASRVLYGLARQGSLPAVLGRVHAGTQVPHLATAVVVAVAALLALSAPVETLAEWTTRVMLGIFILVNLALVRLKLRGAPAPRDAHAWPLAVPVLGALSCAALLLADRLI
ncbi:MAG: amino acid permease [Hyphomicrobiales bacterium]|nr:amino acid permease [Hyphomicrobiales bacterium]